jgi:hypothetical protein
MVSASGRRRPHGLRACLAAILAVAAAVAGTWPPSAQAASGSASLPAGTLHGPADRLDQYPTIGLASAWQRSAAEQLLAEIRASAARWADPAAAAADGYRTGRAARRAGDVAVRWLHAERDPGRPYFDPRRPKAVIYASAPGEPLVLVGVMFALPRGVRGATPGGAITRWHSHYVCMRDGRRGTAALPGGRCAPGSEKREGSEMMHVWLTDDLRSAYAIHAPAPELCLAGRVPGESCSQAARVPDGLARAGGLAVDACSVPAASGCPPWPAPAPGRDGDPPQTPSSGTTLHLADLPGSGRPLVLAVCSLRSGPTAGA